jgi:hypothetical protein
MVEQKLCKCGCGKPTNIIVHTITKKGKFKGEYQDFLPHHHLKNMKKTEKQKKKMSNSRKIWYDKNPEKAKEKAIKCSETKIREGTHKGNKNPNWRNGISKIKDRKQISPKLREKILKRDNYTCQKCNKDFKEKNSLVIHHIDFNKKNNNPSNLITLHHSCHSQLSYKREDWIDYFKKMMIERRLEDG